MNAYGVNVVVAINMFSTDSEAELIAVKKIEIDAGEFDAAICTHHAHGGKGAAEKQIEMYTRQGFTHLPICMAKTQYSLSHNAAEKGAPNGFILLKRDVRAC